MLKKTMLAMAMATAAIATTAVAGPSALIGDKASASAVWTGFVPGSITNSSITITGRDKGDILDGTLLVKEDGSFTSTPVHLESRQYGDHIDGKIGEVVNNVAWTVEGVQVTYNGIGVLPHAFTQDNIFVRFNGTVVNNLDATSKYEENTGLVDVTIENKAEVEGVVPGTAVQAQVTVVATVV